jgi:hypothetical protein
VKRKKLNKMTPPRKQREDMVEKELADKFAIDLDVETQYTGRGTVFKKVGAPLFSLRRGPIGGSMVACFYRRLGSRLIELANLVWIGQPFRSW